MFLAIISYIYSCESAFSAL